MTGMKNSQFSTERLIKTLKQAEREEQLISTIFCTHQRAGLDVIGGPNPQPSTPNLWVESALGQVQDDRAACCFVVPMAFLVRYWGTGNRLPIAFDKALP
jgi:hypothetical protein